MSTQGDTVKQLWTNYDPKGDANGAEFRGIQRITNLFLADAITDSTKAVADIDTRLQTVEKTIGIAGAKAAGGWAVAKGLGIFMVQVVGVAAVMAPLVVILIKYFVK